MSTLRTGIIVSTDRELLRVLSPGDGHTPEERAIALEELERRGGEGVVRERVESASARARLLASLDPEIRSSFEEGKSRDEVMAALASHYEEGEDIVALVDDIEKDIARAKLRSSVTPGSVMKVAAVILIVTVVQGVYLGLVVIGRHENPLYFIPGGIIYPLIIYWGFGGKERAWVTLILMISIILSVILGFMLHDRGLFTADPPML